MFKPPSSSFSLPKRQKENVQVSTTSEQMVTGFHSFLHTHVAEDAYIIKEFYFVWKNGHAVTGQ